MLGVATEEIGEGLVVGVGFAIVDFACGDTVAKHFYKIPKGHLYGGVAFGDGVYVYPVFPVVLVSPFMVEPCGGITEQLALALIWAACTLVIACARQKLGGRILGEIVKKPLPADARAEAMRNDTVAVLGNGVKMAEWVGHKQDPFSVSFFYIIARFAGKVNLLQS